MSARSGRIFLASTVEEVCWCSHSCPFAKGSAGRRSRRSVNYPPGEGDKPPFRGPSSESCHLTWRQNAAYFSYFRPLGVHDGPKRSPEGRDDRQDECSADRYRRSPPQERAASAGSRRGNAPSATIQRRGQLRASNDDLQPPCEERPTERTARLLRATQR